MKLEQYIKQRISHFKPPYLARFEIPIYQGIARELESLLAKIEANEFDDDLALFRE